MQNLKEICKNMTSANKFISNILNSYKENEIIDNKYIIEIIKYHPTKNIDYTKIEWLKKKIRQPYNNLALYYKYKNNIIEDDLSWKLCIRNLYGKFNKNKNYEIDVKNSFRNESHYGSKELFLKNNTSLKNEIFYGKCSNCNIITNDKHVDHYPIPYVEILDKFINENNINLFNIDIYENDKSEIRMKNKDFAKKWLNFHDSLANYRILCRECNIKFGCYDYK